jgi:hypothetical protein
VEGLIARLFGKRDLAVECLLEVTVCKLMIGRENLGEVLGDALRE